jgi:hypothetical protein
MFQQTDLFPRITTYLGMQTVESRLHLLGSRNIKVTCLVPETYPQSPAPSSQKSPLTPEQHNMIEAKRQAALAKVRRTLEGGATGATSVSQMPENSKSTALSSPQKGISLSAGPTTADACKNPQNEPLFQAFVDLTRFYRLEGNYNAASTYYRVSEAIRDLSEEVTAHNALGMGNGKTKVPNIGKASAEKVHAFVTTGRMAKLAEKRAAISSP